MSSAPPLGPHTQMYTPLSGPPQACIWLRSSQDSRCGQARQPGAHGSCALLPAFAFSGSASMRFQAGFSRRAIPVWPGVFVPNLNRHTPPSCRPPTSCLTAAPVRHIHAIFALSHGTTSRAHAPRCLTPQSIVPGRVAHRHHFQPPSRSDTGQLRDGASDLAGHN